MNSDESVSGASTKESVDAAILSVVASTPGVAEVMKCCINSGASVASGGKRECELELHLAVEYGSSIPAIRDSIQAKLEEDVQAATGFEVKSLDLIIEDVRCMPHE